MNFIRYARSQQTKKAEHTRLNRIATSLIRQIHNLEGNKFRLEHTIPENRLNNLKKGSLIVGTQRLVRKGIEAARRRGMQRAARRAISMGGGLGHQVLSRAQIMRFFPAPPTPTPRVRSRVGTVTRSMARRLAG